MYNMSELQNRKMWTYQQLLIDCMFPYIHSQNKASTVSHENQVMHVLFKNVSNLDKIKKTNRKIIDLTTSYKSACDPLSGPLSIVSLNKCIT